MDETGFNDKSKHGVLSIKSIRNVSEDQDNFKLGYNTYMDLAEVFPNSKAIAIQAPPNTSVEINTVGRLVSLCT